MQWAQTTLEETPDEKLLEGMRESDAIFFDETPTVDAIEDGETYRILAMTELWKIYTSSDGVKLSEVK